MPYMSPESLPAGGVSETTPLSVVYETPQEMSADPTDNTQSLSERLRFGRAGLIATGAAAAIWLTGCGYSAEYGTPVDDTSSSAVAPETVTETARETITPEPDTTTRTARPTATKTITVDPSWSAKPKPRKDNCTRPLLSDGSAIVQFNPACITDMKRGMRAYKDSDPSSATAFNLTTGMKLFPVCSAANMMVKVMTAHPSDLGTSKAEGFVTPKIIGWPKNLPAC